MMVARIASGLVSWPVVDMNRLIEYPTTLGGSYEPDPDWRYVDEQGHGHFTARDPVGFPTLNKVMVPCGTPDHDDCLILHHYECKLCGQEIVPAKRACLVPPIIGPTVYTIRFDVFTDEGARIDYTIKAGEEAMAQISHAVRDSIKQVAEELGLPTTTDINMGPGRA